MPDFKFLKDLTWNKWMVWDPKRSKRPNASKKAVPQCPFCIGNEMAERDVYRIGGNPGDSNWQVRVLPNKFPFAPIHEIIVHSPDHHKNLDELPLDQVERLFIAYQQRYVAHSKKGQVYLFSNRGELSGESIPHPHSQLVVIPKDVVLDVRPPLSVPKDAITTNFFSIFAPLLSQWPDEVWVIPKRKDTHFGQIFEEELIDLSFVMQRLLYIMNIRYHEGFSFNYYIRPGKNWYLRFIPRMKIIGSFEVGTGVWVNTQDPFETMQFLKSNFENPDEELICREHRAQYRREV